MPRGYAHQPRRVDKGTPETSPARRALSSTSSTTAPPCLVPNRETDEEHRADPLTDPRLELIELGVCARGHRIAPIPARPLPIGERDPWDLAALIGGLAQVDEAGRCRECVAEADAERLELERVKRRNGRPASRACARR